MTQLYSKLLHTYFQVGQIVQVNSWNRIINLEMNYKQKICVYYGEIE